MDKLEAAALSGALTSAPLAHDDPDGVEPRRNGDDSLLIGPPAATNGDGLPTHPGGGRAHEATRTGPKGVLQDYRHARTDAARPRQMSAEVDEVDAAAEAQAIEAYRRARLAELQRTGSAAGKPFGHLREIGVEAFDDAVLGAPAGTKVVLLLYEPVRPSAARTMLTAQHIRACEPVLHHLSSLARRHPRTKFLRARASELDFALNTAAAVLPTLLVYDSGELVANLVAVHHEWDQREDVSEADVEAVLLDRGAIERSFSPQLGVRGPAFVAASDDDDDA